MCIRDSFSDATTFYLGTDRYNEENFRRFRDQIVEVALEAYETREDAKIGMGWEYDWDPENRIYSDRRGVNNELRPWGENEPEWVGGKDPWLGMLRFDTLQDEPIAMLFNFGMHGIIVDVESPLVLSLIHISEPTRQEAISYAVFCLKKKT